MPCGKKYFNRAKGQEMKLFAEIALFIVILFAAVRYIERRTIYFPMKTIEMTPSSVNLAYEEVYFKTSDNIRLNGWFIPSQQAKFTVIFCHGNAGNISHRLEKIMIFHNLGVNVFIFDYRGYGKSGGIPNEQGLYEDLNAACSYLREERKIAVDSAILYGESIGGAVVIDFARKTAPAAIITENTLSSAKDMAAAAFPFIPRFFLSSRFDSLSKIKSVACRKLIIHSVDDEIVLFSQGEKLFNAAAGPKQFLKIKGSHNTAFLDSKEEFTQGIKSFLDGL